MLARDGFLDIEEIKDIPGFPGLEVLSQKKCVVVECSQNIPCNPCETVCPNNAITVGEPITNLPVIDPDKCIGCGICLAICPGLAIFMVNKNAGNDEATVSFPYEYLPVPVKGDTVKAVDRAGKVICDATIEKAAYVESYDKTIIITIRIPLEHADNVRGIERKGGI